MQSITLRTTRTLSLSTRNKGAVIIMVISFVDGNCISYINIFQTFQRGYWFHGSMMQFFMHVRMTRNDARNLLQENYPNKSSNYLLSKSQWKYSVKNTRDNSKGGPWYRVISLFEQSDLHSSSFAPTSRQTPITVITCRNNVISTITPFNLGTSKQL